jgi:hypothetical protein
VPGNGQAVSQIYALLSEGDGTFTRQLVLDPTQPFFHGPTEDAIPLRADGNDLDDLCVLFAPASLPGSWRVGLYLRDLAGGFQESGALVTLPRQPDALHAGDVDADGLDDVVIEYVSPPGFEVLLSNGTALFHGVFPVNFPGDPSRGMAVGTLGGPAGADVVSLRVAEGPNALTYGSGFLLSPPVTDPDLLGEKAAAAIGDLSGDGVADLVFAIRVPGPADTILAYTGRGDLTFAPTATSIPIAGALIGSPVLTIAVGDVNGDGRPDVLHTDLGQAPGTHRLRVSLQE